MPGKRVRHGCWLVTLVIMLVAGNGASASGAPSDARQWEKITPADKNGADVLVDSTQVRAAADGGAVVFTSFMPFGDSAGSLITAEYMGVRAGGGWNVHGISPEQGPLTVPEASGALRPGYLWEFSADLSKGVYLANTPLTDAPNVAGASNLYLRSDLRTPGAGTYQLIDDATTPQPPGDSGNVAGTSDDFTRVLFESVLNLTDDAVAAGLDLSLPKLYEWVDGSVRLVGILPADEGGGVAPTSQAGQGARLQNSASTISADGSRIVFAVQDTTGAVCPNGAGTCGALYLRDDQGTSDVGDDETIHVGTSERTDCADDPVGCTGSPAPDPAGAGQPVTFWGGTADLSSLFFTSKEQLTDDDHNGFVDLYRWDRGGSGQHLSRLSVDTELSDGDGTDVLGVVGTSSDGSYVYFVADTSGGQMAVGGPTGAVGGPIGGARLYVSHAGTVREVGGLNLGTETDRTLGAEPWDGATKQARVTPDGTHLIFTTQGNDELLGYDQGDTCAPWGSATQCSEIYVYDATANGGDGQLSCASCNPTGQTATADATLIARFATGAASRTVHLGHNLSDDGRFVFFTSAERLVPEDENGKQDAYEYDTTTGLVHLISSGKSTSDSFFLDASANGHDAFIATREQLVSGDQDQSMDLYDARVDGNADQPAPVVTPCASADACHAAPTSPLASPLLGSEQFQGPGDALEGPSAPAVFSVHALTRRQARKLVRTGSAIVTVNASRAGRLVADVKARIGGRLRGVGTSAATVHRGGAAHLRIRLGTAARKQLARTGRLDVVIVIDYSRVAQLQRIGFTLHAG